MISSSNKLGGEGIFYAPHPGGLANSTYLRGSGVMENGIEKPNLKVTLASKISAEDCAQLNLGYLDPSKIHLDGWKDREEQGVLYTPAKSTREYNK